MNNNFRGAIGLVSIVSGVAVYAAKKIYEAGMKKGFSDCQVVTLKMLIDVLNDKIDESKKDGKETESDN